MMTRVHAQPYDDFERREYLLALLIALSIPVWAGLALRVSRLDRHATAPAIVAGDAIPIRITPVIDFDSPLLKLGGKRKVRLRLPKMWAPPPKPVAKKRVVRKAHVSTKATDAASAAPPADLPLAAASEAPPDASAELIREQDEDVPATSDDEPQVEGPGAADGSEDGTEIDPLKARAASLYAGRIRQFLRQRFRVVQCTEEMAAVSVGWSATLVSGGQVSSCQISPSGNATLDGAAQAACSAAQGQQIPPPENYPEFGSRVVGGRFRCQAPKSPEND
jgi:hypothetical protein